MNRLTILRLLCVILLPGMVQGEELVDFNREIRPLLSSRCVACHGPDENERMADLRLDTPEGATADLGGYAAIVPGEPEASVLIARIASDDEDELMPPTGKGQPLSTAEIALIKRWIEQGAQYQTHWSYKVPVKSALPAVKRTRWPINEIDRFLLARIEAEGLQPTAEADRRTLARRAALDLTGLPPTISEVEAFVNDTAPQAYDRFVDLMLGKPAFGEHWARRWLDHARYADSSGYPSDQPRQIWAYRDWVISAFNRNLPFDQFTIEQLAGDLLDKPTDDQLIATAFHRNTMTQNEGGTSDEEYRVAAVVDRTNTTMEVWMGTTMACAQCHTHKFDPITQQEYFQVFAILNQSADADRKDESPVLEFFTAEQNQRRAAIESQLQPLNTRFANPQPAELAALQSWSQSLLTGDLRPNTFRLGVSPLQTFSKLTEIPPAVLVALALPTARRSDQQVKLIQDHYLRRVSPTLAQERRQFAALQKELDGIRPATVPIMRELPENQRRITKIQQRGNWMDLGEEVKPGFPSAFHAAPSDRPVDRLALAQWLVSPENPLTARVVVNRFWESLFGVGIVQTSEDFGAQGEPPFHPELLDWLAADFVQHRWDVKRLLRQFVTSRAYRQDSSSTADLSERDPDNRLLARGPRFRPTGEQLRDQALFVSGLLTKKVGGPPVRPMAPSLGLKTAFGRSNDWQTSPGEDRYRRSVYTEVQRNSPYPSFTTFDAPNRETCTIRRNRTNTPLQAFVTLNDPVFVEANQGLARRLIKELPAASVEDRIALAFELCVSRQPQPEEQRVLSALFQETLTALAADRDAAIKLATDPIGAAPAGIDLAELAAWTVTANVIMNLDEYLMRR